MARPQRIEKLRHGRLLCGSVFRFFVETWNWLTAYVDNMRGDAETDPQSGYITIDRADPDHPVIRFRADKVAAGGGGGAAETDGVSLNTRTADGKAQIKDWNAGTPVASSTIAADLKASGANAGHVVFRESDGSLTYKPIGLLGGITETGLKIVTDIQWSTTNHRLEIEHATVNVVNGIITSWTESGDQTIDTTSISSIINPT